MADWKFLNPSFNYQNTPIGKDYNFTVNYQLQKNPETFPTNVHPIYLKGLPFLRHAHKNEKATPPVSFFGIMYDNKGNIPSEHSGFNITSSKVTIIPDWNCLGIYEPGFNYKDILPQLAGDAASTFSTINTVGKWGDSSITAVTCLKPMGYGSGFGMPYTAYDSSKWPKSNKPTWESIQIGPINDGDEEGFNVIRYAVRDKLNSAELKDLHPIQVKVCFHNVLWGESYSATIFYTHDYPNTAPHTFVNGDNNMILPYCNNNGHEEQFNKWCWVQRPFADKTFYGTSPEEVISMLGKLPPAEQFMAQITNAVTVAPNSNAYYYMMVPIGYYQGYKKIVNGYDPDNFKPNSKIQSFVFLNLTGGEVDVYIADSGKWRKNDPANGNAIYTRNDYMLDTWYNLSSNSVFQITKKGQPNNIIGTYEMVDTPDLYNHKITIIIE